MNGIIRRIISFVLVVIISIGSIEVISAESTENTDAVFDEREVLEFIGFVFNVNPKDVLERIDLDDNSIYQLLTGQYAPDSQEEKIVKEAFLLMVYDNININISKQSNIESISRASLLEYLEDQISNQAVAEHLLITMAQCAMREIWGFGDDIIKAFEQGWEAIKNMTLISEKTNAYVQNVHAAIMAGTANASKDKELMYKYFMQYVNAYVDMGEYADCYMEQYYLSLSGSVLLLDPILNWRSEDNIETLKRWAKLVADIELSLKVSDEQEKEYYAKFSLNYPFAQDITCYTAQETIDFFQSDMFIPERDGYEFLGWYYDVTGTREWYGDFQEGQQLFAKWKKLPETEFIITFKSNCESVDDFSYTYDTTVGNWIDYTMTRSGYIHAGWFWDSACTQPVTGTITINKDLTFYAKWVRQFSYTVSNDQATITRLEAYAVFEGQKVTDIEIPDSIDGYQVTSIGKKAFCDCDEITSITIPSSVTTIGDSAFLDCTSLAGVHITDLSAWCKVGFSNIYSNPLYIAKKLYVSNVLVEKLVIPDGVTRIGNNVFYGCNSIKTAVIPDGVTHIGVAAFSSCSNLTNIEIPDSVTSIGNSAFAKCERLTELTLPESVISIGDNAFFSCNSLIEIAIPHSVKNISTSTFYYCSNLENVIIPNSVTNIGDYAFSHCISLAEVTIPGSVKSIGSNVFENCDNLTDVIISEGVTDIGKYMFVNCISLKDVIIPDTVKNIGHGAFAGCKKLMSATIGKGVTSIGGDAFRFCDALENVFIPEGVTSIGTYAFYHCDKLKDITIPDSVTSIGEYTFSNCDSFTQVIIPSGLTNIGNYAFAYCNALKNITVDENNAKYVSVDGVLFNKNKTKLIQYPVGNLNASYIVPDGVTSIGTYSFVDSANLESMILPNSLTSIEENTFYKSDSLTDVYFLGTEDEWEALKGNIGRNNSDLLNATIHIQGNNKELIEKTIAEISELNDGSNETAALIHQINEEINAMLDDYMVSDIEATRIEKLQKEARMRCGVLNIRFQISAGTTSDSESSDIRFISTVDKLKYKETGFYITINGIKKRIATRNVYTGLVGKNGETAISYTPSDIFEESKWFSTYSVRNVPQSAFDAPITVQAFVVNMDGTETLGVEKIRTIRNYIK